MRRPCYCRDRIQCQFVLLRHTQFEVIQQRCVLIFANIPSVCLYMRHWKAHGFLQTHEKDDILWIWYGDVVFERKVIPFWWRQQLLLDRWKLKIQEKLLADQLITIWSNKQICITGADEFSKWQIPGSKIANKMKRNSKNALKSANECGRNEVFAPLSMECAPHVEKSVFYPCNLHATQRSAQVPIDQ